ncbi:hypothetical protein [Bacillus sp. JJ1764]|uniref:hypothetical protein n=1 Tax=Bacillus sp. JJ1764 TaxID=3122964 RepID=UPI002FFDD730
MFLEKHESAAVEEFSWFDENGNHIDSEEPKFKLQISKINRYIVEVSQNNTISIPKFIYWLFENDYKIYCFNDCRDYMDSLTKIQRIIFEKKQSKAGWISFPNNNNVYVKEFKTVNDVEIIWDAILFCSKSNLDYSALENIFEEFKLTTSRFPNLSFTRLLPKYKDLIIGKISFGESYFKPGTFEEPMVFICYTVNKL